MSCRLKYVHHAHSRNLLQVNITWNEKKYFSVSKKKYFTMNGNSRERKRKNVENRSWWCSRLNEKNDDKTDYNYYCLKADQLLKTLNFLKT